MCHSGVLQMCTYPEERLKAKYGLAIARQTRYYISSYWNTCLESCKFFYHDCM